jgi:hypothetical protein
MKQRILFLLLTFKIRKMPPFGQYTFNHEEEALSAGFGAGQSKEGTVS